MASYKRNHALPRFMIEYWIDESTQYRGVHGYDINSRKNFISTSQGKTPFSFAVTNDLYILAPSNERLVGIEKWFNGQESALADLLRQAHNRKEIKLSSSFEMTKLLMALTGLEYRSNYVIKKLLDHIIDNENQRKLISSNPERSPKQLVLENLIHIITEQHLKYLPTEMVFLVAPEGCNFILSDRPFINHDSLEYRFVILTNKIALGYCRSNEFTYEYKESNEDFVDILNELVVRNAREWMIAKNENDLKKYSVQIHTEEWNKGVAGDRIIWNPNRYLPCGWTIDR